MSLSTLDMSRYAFIEYELTRLRHTTDVLENKNAIVQYLDYELAKLDDAKNDSTRNT